MPAMEKECGEDFPRFLGALLKYLSWHNRGRYQYIVENCYISVENAIKFFDQDSTILIFLGYSELTAEEAFQNYRENEKETDWTKEHSDENMLNHAREWVEKSKVFKRDCEKFGVRYVDVSWDREKVLKELVDELVEELKK